MSMSETDVVAFGEILWDVIEGVPHLGGAPFNFAAHCALCGLKSAIVSSVGGDDLGRKACELARSYGVDVSGVSVHPALPTGTVLVTLKDGSDISIIVSSEVLVYTAVADSVLLSVHTHS